MRTDLKFSLCYSAQYQVEDAAALLLNMFDKSVLKEPSKIDCDKFSKFLNINIFTEYLESECLAVFALDPQCVRGMNGKKIYLCRGDGIVERLNAESNIQNYNYLTMLICALALDLEYYVDKEKQDTPQEDAQLSFNFFETQSENKLEIGIDDLEKVEMDGGKGALRRAENLCGSLLMPKNNFKKAANNLFNQLDINRNTMDIKGLDYILLELSELFCVPKAFVFTRLHRLNYI